MCKLSTLCTFPLCKTPRQTKNAPPAIHQDASGALLYLVEIPCQFRCNKACDHCLTAHQSLFPNTPGAFSSAVKRSSCFLFCAVTTSRLRFVVSSCWMVNLILVFMPFTASVSFPSSSSRWVLLCARFSTAVRRCSSSSSVITLVLPHVTEMGHSSGFCGFLCHVIFELLLGIVAEREKARKAK